MIKRLALAALCLAAALSGGVPPSASAESRPPMTADDFRAVAEGWTLHFRNEAGEYFGSEQYLPGGRTVWLPQGGNCTPGSWVEESGRICFLYEIGVSCWRLFREGEDGIYAESANETDVGEETRLWSVRRDKAPVLCPDGPGV